MSVIISFQNILNFLMPKNDVVVQKTMKNIAQEEANAMKTLICVDIVTFGLAEKMQEKRSWTCAEILNKKTQKHAK